MALPSNARRRRRLRLGCLSVVALLFLAALVDYFNYPWSRPSAAPTGDRGETGLWLRYTHYFGKKRDDELATLAQNLKARRIRWAYFHVRSAETNGSLRFHYPAEARHLLSVIRRENPDVRCLAWVYVGNKKDEGAVELSRPEVRHRLVEEARWLVETCGFDGVQWDYEICPNGDRDFLKLLEKTRAALPKEKTLGVCSPVWLPLNGLLGWSEDYISEVAARCDQVAVMGYDTGFVTPRAYVWLVGQNVARFTRAVRAGNPNGKVMLGVPTYGPGFRSHNPRAENLENALRGVREGLIDPSAVRENFAGVAPFADYTTDDDEWETWRRDWLAK